MDIKKIESNKFKTTQISLFLSAPLKKENTTEMSLIESVLSRGCKKYPDMYSMNRALEDMYGAKIFTDIYHNGVYRVLKFSAEVINDKYTFNNENLANKVLELLFEIAFNPLVENNKFNEKYVKQEKENLVKLIESRKDNKAGYARIRCIEEMFKDEIYGESDQGRLEDIEKITSEDLYSEYQKFISTAKADIVMCGENLDGITIPEIKLEEKLEEPTIAEHKVKEKVKVVKEKMDVNQGKLVIGLNVKGQNIYANQMYNTILGGGANSKLFQNVREKASLAYQVGSNYDRRRNAIFIRAGIEFENYNKTLEIINKQIEDIKNGNVTDDEFLKSKELIISSLEGLKEEKGSLISYYYDRKLNGENITIDEHINEIKKITLDDVVDAAKDVTTDTIYFLEGGDA